MFELESILKKNKLSMVDYKSLFQNSGVFYVTEIDTMSRQLQLIGSFKCETLTV